MSTVPIISPEGIVGDIPFAQLNAALAAGGKPGVTIKSPDGKLGVVPADRYQDAVKAGGKVVPFGEQETQHPGFWAKAADLMGGLLHPSGFSPYPGMDQDAKSAAAAESSELNQSEKAAGYSAPYRALVPAARSVGVDVPGMEQSAREGDVGGVAAAAAVPLATLAAGEALSHAGPAVSDAARSALDSPTGEAAVAGTKAALKKVVPAAIKRIPYVGNVAGDVAEAARTAYTKSKIARTAESAPGATAADDLEGVTSPQTASAGEVNEVEPPLPSAAPAVSEQPRATPTAAASPATAASESTPAPKATLSTLEKQINDALGGKARDKAAPIYNRPKPLTNLQQQIADSAEPSKATPKAPLTNLQKQISAAANPLPEGFTATPDSSLLQGYKYDPENQRFSVVLNNGESYTHGEVSPEQAKAFEESDSQGSAWTKKIKQGPGTVLVEKNGVPVKKAARTVVTDPETGRREFSDVVEAKQSGAQTPPAPQVKTAAAAPAPKTANTAVSEGDLTSLLQKSVDEVVAQPGGVFTSAVPKDLLDRWGVDPESFTEGRSQTRGMSPDETAASIKKLTAAYKLGQPVEPVMETRDAANNITDVDGRGRALAAHRAGIERIPVIVRRMPTAQ